MCFKAWRRKSFRKKARNGLLRHRRAVHQLKRAKASLQTIQTYNPLCLGGLEDRIAWVDEAETAVERWSRERERTEKFLGASHAQITRLRRLAERHRSK
jgi:hypothetical protein